jgi:predicted MFS family arabinose efflux permease
VTWLLIIDIWIFVLGDLIAGLSKNLNQLVAGRLISGVGGSGLLSLSVIIVSRKLDSASCLFRSNFPRGPLQS